MSNATANTSATDEGAPTSIRRPHRARLLFAFGLAALFVSATGTGQAQSRTIRIMPLGDSLTSSLNDHASYRYWLWKKLQNNGFKVDFVGSQWGVGDGSGTPSDFDQNHEGHPAATTRDILTDITTLASQSQPDVVLMLVGGTDLERGIPPNQALVNSVRIITRLRAVNPRVRILWAMLPPASDQMAAAQMYNAGLLQMAAALSRPNSPIRIVNLWTGIYPATDTVDGVHPNQRGEQKFANRFLTVLAPLLRRM